MGVAEFLTIKGHRPQNSTRKLAHPEDFLGDLLAHNRV